MARASRNDETTRSSRTGTVHYEEVLSSRTTNRQWLAALAIVAGMMAAVPGFALVYGLLFARAELRLSLPIGVVVLIGGLLYFVVRNRDDSGSGDAGTVVKVTDYAVTVERNTWTSKLPYASGIRVPFESIRGVQYSRPDEPKMQVSKRDHENHVQGMKQSDEFVTTASGYAPRLFYVEDYGNKDGAHTYEGGVRIAREGAPPVYIGSESPVRLADEIVERAPAVSTATRFEDG